MVDGQPEGRVLSRPADRPANLGVPASTSAGNVDNPPERELAKLPVEIAIEETTKRDTAYRVIT